MLMVNVEQIALKVQGTFLKMDVQRVMRQGTTLLVVYVETIATILGTLLKMDAQRAMRQGTRILVVYVETDALMKNWP
jgi:hypothetical protein